MKEFEVCCEGSWPSDMYGPAITEIYIDKDTGKMWADNGEYSTQVNYCPICGTKAMKEIK